MQLSFYDKRKKGNSQSLFYIFLDNALHIFTLPNGSVSSNNKQAKKGNSQSSFYIFLDNTLHIFTLPEWFCIEQHYIWVIAHLVMRNADLGNINAEKIEN